ncbi:UNVERIFIED_CONTAM: arginine utilization protein RocB [Brevibacillus sp. OAP136]
MAYKWSTKEQMTDLLCNLVSIPSITGSEAEIAFPRYVVEQLQALPYFQQHPEHLHAHPTGDGRYFVTALVKNKPETKDTIVLVSHFDVVDVEDYGNWKEFAFAPKKLSEMFRANKADMPADVQEDLGTGDWLFGRGTMDMKCGLALHMSLIEEACDGGFDGNLLLLTVPDEEVNSVGMKAAVPLLLEWAEKFDLSYKTVLNSEPMFTRYPGDRNAYIYNGSIGKVMPGFLCYGKETHVGEPLAGLNGNFMSSHITTMMELNTAFCERVENEVTPPPTNQILKSLKKDYSVQIPHRSVTLFNLFLYEWTMEEIVTGMRRLATMAAEQIKESYAANAERYAQLDSFTPTDINVNVYTYDELLKYAGETYGDERVERIRQDVLNNTTKQDERDITINLVDELAILCKELSPMIVLFFAPPYYPAVCSRRNPLISSVVSDMIAYANEQHGVELKKQNYFGGISDLSYVGLQHPASTLTPLTTNMPLWNRGYSVPLEALERFDVPVLNLGPVGRDAHKWTERLDTDFAFVKLPDMLRVCIRKLFTEQTSVSSII